MEAEDGAWGTSQQSENADGLPASTTVDNTDNNSAAPTLESQLPELVPAAHESPERVQINGEHSSIPDISPIQHSECVERAVETLASQSNVSEDEVTSRGKDLISPQHELPQHAERNGEHPYIPGISPILQGECDAGAVEILTSQTNISEDQVTSGAKDLDSTQHDFFQPAKSKLYNPSKLDNYLTKQDDYVAEALEAHAQGHQYCTASDQCTASTQASLASNANDSHQCMENNLNLPSVSAISSTQQPDFCPDTTETLAQPLQIIPQCDVCGEQHIPLAEIGKAIYLTDSNPNSPTASDVTPSQLGTQTPQLHATEDQCTTGTENIISAHHELAPPTETNPNNPLQIEDSSAQQVVLFSVEEEAAAEALSIYVPGNLSVAGLQNILVLPHYESPVAANSPSESYVPQIQQGENVPEAYEILDHALQIYMSEEQCISTTQDLLVMVVQEPKQSEASGPVCLSFRGSSSFEQKVCVPRTLETGENAPQTYLSIDENMLGMPEVETNETRRNPHASSKNNCMSGTESGVTTYEENKHSNKEDVFSLKGMSKDESQSSVRDGYSISGSISSISSIKSISANGSPDMFSSHLSLFDTDDETDKAESYETMMSLVDLYSDYFEDLEENQSEEYIITMISTYVDVASNKISDLRLLAARIFTSPTLVGNIVYDINWTFLYLAVDDEVDLFDVGSYYKLRLLRVKDYIRTTSKSTAEGVIAETLQQEFMPKDEITASVEPSFSSEQSGCSSQVASTPRGPDSEDGAIAEAVTTASDWSSDRKYSGGVGEGALVYVESCGISLVDEKTRQRAAVLKIRSIAEERVCRIRAINWVMLSCFKTVINVLGLGLEAKRLAERAAEEAMRRQLPGTNHIVAAAAKVAIAATNCADQALKQVQQAVELHRAVAGSLRRAEAALFLLGKEAAFGRNDILDIVTCVAVIEQGCSSRARPTSTK